jgi:hypothetical protein
LWGIPCDATLPDFEMEIGNGTAVIPGWLMSAGRILDLGLLNCELLLFFGFIFFGFLIF